MDPPIGPVKVVPDEVEILNQHVVSPVGNINNLAYLSWLALSHSNDDHRSPELIRSVGDNGYMWLPLP